jgi:hypothetical protein
VELMGSGGAFTVNLPCVYRILNGFLMCLLVRPIRAHKGR